MADIVVSTFHHSCLANQSRRTKHECPGIIHFGNVARLTPDIDRAAFLSEIIATKDHPLHSLLLNVNCARPLRYTYATHATPLHSNHATSLYFTLLHSPPLHSPPLHSTLLYFTLLYFNLVAACENLQIQ